jgi:hypothetical protein
LFLLLFFLKQWLVLQALVLLQTQALLQVMIVLYDMNQKATMLFHVGFIACTFGDLFIATEMEEGNGHSMDPTNGVQDVLATL